VSFCLRVAQWNPALLVASPIPQAENVQAIDGMVSVLEIIKYDSVLNPLQFPFIRFFEAKGKT
jgi:hypothetical protein